MAIPTSEYLSQLVAEAEALARSGQGDVAHSRWEKILELDPRNATALNQLGARALKLQDTARALDYLQRAIAAAPKLAMAHANLSRLHVLQGNRIAALDALSAAIAADPLAWGAHAEKATLLEDLDQPREAALHWGNALQYMPEQARQSPQLQPMIQHAQAAAARNLDELSGFLAGRLKGLLAGHGQRELERIRHSLDIIAGRRSFVTARPLSIPIPRLPAIPIFHREDFDWVPAVESAFPAILSELNDLLRQQDGFEPYVQTPVGEPKGQFEALDRQPDWSAYFLWNHGKRIDAQADRCPATEAAIAQAPQMIVPGRAPAIFFSALKPGTHIPAHNGATNARLTVHLPLIIPPDCALKVGDEVHIWKPGELVLFDDTIRHEAWNYSDRLRVVLIFDVWHPMLTPLEREMVTLTTTGMMEYYGDSADLGEL